MTKLRSLIRAAGAMSFVAAVTAVAVLAFCQSACKVGGKVAPVTIAAGGYHSLAIMHDGGLWAWGNNEQGQLGDGTNADKSLPVQVGGAKDWVAVAAGGYHTLAIKANGALWAWGCNNRGQLGDGTNTDRNVPVQVGRDRDWAAVAAGDYHTLAIKANGTLWAWGSNENGQAGTDDHNTNQYNAPVQVGADSDWAAVAVRGNTAAIKADGSLWAWGVFLDRGSTTFGWKPMQIGAAGEWAAAAGGYVTVAIKTDGSLWVWGDARSGNFSEGAERVDFIQVGAAGEWADAMEGITLEPGQRYSVALKTDGSIWAWGNNSVGQLGVGDSGEKTDRAAPVQVGQDNDWAAVAAGGYHTLALKANGGLWAWGGNQLGQVGTGDGNESLYPAPVKVGAGYRVPPKRQSLHFASQAPNQTNQTNPPIQRQTNIGQKGNNL